MNRLPLRRPRPQAALFLLLCTALPSAALAQEPAAPQPVAAPAVPAFIAAETSPLGQKRMLAQDTRLDRPISLDVISVPLDEVLQKESLDKSTEKMEDGKRFLLTAAPDCADLKLQVRLNARPLRTLMTALAEMLPGVWTHTPHGYQLSMTKQAADARAEWWNLFLGEREKALALQRLAVLAAMQTKAHRRQADDPDPEQSDRVVEEDMADQHDFFQSLPSALKKQIAANMDESPFYEAGNTRFGNDREQSGAIGLLSQMSPQTQEKFKAAMQASVNRLAQAPPTFQKYAVQAQKGLTAFDPTQVYFSFLNGGFSVLAIPFNAPPTSSTILGLDVPTPLSMPLLMLNQKQLADEVYGSGDISPGLKQWADRLRKQGDTAPSERKHIIYLVYGMGDAAPPEWKRLADYQRSRVWPNVLPKLPPVDHTVYHPSVSRAAETDWLGERGHMEYVSDYYSHGGYEMPAEQKKLPVKRPLATELDEMAAKRDVSWTKDAAGITLVRNNRWYRDDALEVPQPLLRRWFGMHLQAYRQGVPQTPQTPEERTAAMRQNWDWAAEVFSILSPWQIRNGLALFQPEEKDLAPQNDAMEAKINEKVSHQMTPAAGTAPLSYDPVMEATRTPPFLPFVSVIKGYPHTIHLYSSLDDAGRSALLEGHLPATALSPAQLAQAASLQPFLLQAMQSFPPASVFLDLRSRMETAPRHVSFGYVPPSRLELSTPTTPQSAP